MSIRITREGHEWHVHAQQDLPAPLAAVFPFFAEAHNLERLTPSFLRFHVLTPAPIEMRPGALIDYKLRVRGVPIRWRTEILDWRPPHRFVDVQLRGPYALWHHTHTFEDRGESTRCVDLVRYRPPGGPLAGLVNGLVVQRDVESIFRFRMARLDEIFSAGPAATLPA
ncbi:MAG: SRPBCC family protein [Phycisphaerales bacterium]